MENTKSYTGLFIITPGKLDSVDDVRKSISTVITENEGNIVKDSVIGKRKLAYPIKKQAEGIYYEVSFTVVPASVPKMMREFRINIDLLRALVDKS